MAWEAGLHNVPSAVTPFKPVLVLPCPSSLRGQPRSARQDQVTDGFSRQEDESLPWGLCWREPEEDGRVTAAGFWVRFHLVSSQQNLAPLS